MLDIFRLVLAGLVAFAVSPVQAATIIHDIRIRGGLGIHILDGRSGRWATGGAAYDTISADPAAGTTVSATVSDMISLDSLVQTATLSASTIFHSSYSGTSSILLNIGFNGSPGLGYIENGASTRSAFEMVVTQDTPWRLSYNRGPVSADGIYFVGNDPMIHIAVSRQGSNDPSDGLEPIDREGAGRLDRTFGAGTYEVLVSIDHPNDPELVQNGFLSQNLFWSMSAVPEPATWALLICGFTLVGGNLRWKRRRLHESHGRAASAEHAPFG